MVCANFVFYYRRNFSLVNKDSKNSIHLKSFVKIPKNWENEKLNDKWSKILTIRDKANISIESKRSLKEIGSSLEASIQINLSKSLFEISKDFDFSELCITSYAEPKLDEKVDNVEVLTTKAEGTKCKVCWKIRKEKCERHG